VVERPEKQKLHLVLTTRHVAELDQVAPDAGIGVSELLRRLLDSWVARRHAAKAPEELVHGNVLLEGAYSIFDWRPPARPCRPTDQSGILYWDIALVTRAVGRDLRSCYLIGCAIELGQPKKP
jgi:hypothetical protein